MKTVLTACLLSFSFGAKAQKIDSVFVNLYTDSLKKGTYNYINVDGLLKDGSYLPLDTNHLRFSSSVGKFYGNSLWIEPTLHSGPVTINIEVKNDPTFKKTLVLYIKIAEEEKLKTNEEILAEMRQNSGRKKKS
ncbi:MAG: hypothetical protein EOP53_25895 [Sphingobacteriales bacterium]|nr:MAG: hypothetical protein EOP53_25895 [Sphingobacteriales bacterium]